MYRGSATFFCASDPHYRTGAGSTQNTRPANIEANHLRRRNYIHGNPERIWKSGESGRPDLTCRNRVNRKPVHSSRLVIIIFSFWEVFVTFVIEYRGRSSFFHFHIAYSGSIKGAPIPNKSGSDLNPWTWETIPAGWVHCKRTRMKRKDVVSLFLAITWKPVYHCREFVWRDTNVQERERPGPRTAAQV